MGLLGFMASRSHNADSQSVAVIVGTTSIPIAVSTAQTVRDGISEETGNSRD